MQVFLSYDRADKELAQQLSRALREEGVSTWLDEDMLQPGDDWFQAIANALETSDAMVVLVTPSALTSSWVRRELEHAMLHSAYKNRLIPVWLPGVDRSAAPTVLNIVHGLPLNLDNVRSTAGQVASALRAAA